MQFKKWPEDLNRHFSKEDIEMPNRHEKMLSVTNQLYADKTTMRYPFISFRMAVINKSRINKCW